MLYPITTLILQMPKKKIPYDFVRLKEMEFCFSDQAAAHR